MLILYILYCGIALDFCEVLKMNNLDKNQNVCLGAWYQGFQAMVRQPCFFLSCVETNRHSLSKCQRPYQRTPHTLQYPLPPSKACC